MLLLAGLFSTNWFAFAGITPICNTCFMVCEAALWVMSATPKTQKHNLYHYIAKLLGGFSE